MFALLYELVLGQNSDPTYVDDIFRPVGTITLIGALLVAVIFYLLLGRWQAVFHQTKHWVITLVLVAGAGFVLALQYAYDLTQAIEYDSYLVGFACLNAVFAALLFFLFSLPLRRFGRYAKSTPF